MRFRLGGWAVAAGLVLGGCGVDGGTEDASAPLAAVDAALDGPELVSARDTLPLAPPSSASTALTVLLTRAGGAADPGLDAAAAALAQRPDIRVVIAAPGDPADGATTMSGFPVTLVDPSDPDLVESAIETTGIVPDLVVIGIDEAPVVGGLDPISTASVRATIPALVVQTEAGGVVDHAAAAMQLLDVLDLELATLLDEPAGVHRLTVPSCRSGTLRGRLTVEASLVGEPLAASDCSSTARAAPTAEVDAVRAGYAALTRLP